MADKTSELERIYTIPLRRVKMGTRSKRADRAVRAVRSYLERHMKSDQIWLDGEVNHALWARGKFTIPSRIRVRATRFSDGVVEVTMPDTETTGSVREELKERREKAAESPVLTTPEEHEHVPGDDRPVTDVKGIGPATADKLEEKAEITSLAALAAATAAAVSAATGVSETKAQEWIDAAKALQSEASAETEGTEAEAGGEAADGPAAADAVPDDEVLPDDSEE